MGSQLIFLVPAKRTRGALSRDQGNGSPPTLEAGRQLLAPLSTPASLVGAAPIIRRWPRTGGRMSRAREAIGLEIMAPKQRIPSGCDCSRASGDGWIYYCLTRPAHQGTGRWADLLLDSPYAPAREFQRRLEEAQTAQKACATLLMYTVSGRGGQL